MDKTFIELAAHAARRTAPENYTQGTVDEAFRGELAKLCSSVAMFMKNRYDLYEVITKNADEIMPGKVIDRLGMFAEVVQVPQGTKVKFKTSKTASKLRAKKFLTQVGLSGVYETGRLDQDTFELNVQAIGGGMDIDFERILDGSENLADVMEVLTEGLTDAVFCEVQKALRACVDANMPEANKVLDSAFDGDKMFKLCSTVKAYGSNAVIYAPPEFVGAMGPDAIVPVTAQGAQGIYAPQDIEAIHNTGYINLFRGFPIVQIPQTFVDTNNDTTWIDPQLAYVLPVGSRGERIVQVVLEGNTQMYDRQNRDQSMEINCYRKIGAAIITYYNFGVYRNSGIPQTMYNPYGF